MGASTGRTFKVTGAGAAFAAQGGVAGGCGIPAGVDAVEATILVPGPSGDGFMRAFPSNAPEPSASVVYFNGGQNSANTAGLAVCSSGCPAAGELTLKVYSSSTHVAVVANGYYIKPIAAAVRTDGTLGRNSRAVSSQRLEKGLFEVVFDRDVSTCSWQGSASTEDSLDYPGMVMLEQRIGNDNAIFVVLQDKDGELVDIPFEVLVTC